MLSGLKRYAITKELERLLDAYEPVLKRFGIRIMRDQFIAELLVLYEAKGKERPHADR